MCHQAIEKMLYPYYVKLREEHAPRTHNLNVLASESDIRNDMSEAQLDLLDVLELLNIEARYPTNKEQIMKSLNHDRCKHILNSTKEMMLWIKDKLLK